MGYPRRPGTTSQEVTITNTNTDTNTSTSGPKTIYLIRHGEKLGDPTDDKDGGPHLSLRGSSRAAALPSLFTPTATDPLSFLSCEVAPDRAGYKTSFQPVQLEDPGSPPFKRPDFIFATKPDSHSERPLETITPLGVALSLVPDASHDDDHYADVANVIKTEPQFGEKVVLICWHHGNLQALAQAIGAQGAQPWLGTVFDQVWEIDYSSDPGQLKVGYQSLLYGDTAS